MTSSVDMDYLMHHDISDEDISKMITEVNIIPYHKLATYSDINDLFKNDWPCILLYEQFRNTGHFTCLQRIINHSSTGDPPEMYIEYFDPLAFPIDELISVWREHIPHYLSILLHKHPEFNIISSHERVQNINLNTCGRHVVTRLYNKDKSLSQYLRFLHRRGNMDMYVTRFTSGLESENVNN